MGLDMYLSRMPRYRGATANDVSAVEYYLDWQKSKAEDSKYANYTFEEWCGYKKIPSQSYIDFYSQFYTEGKYGFCHISEEVGYWRKANAIHKWFVDNIQDGVDDCNYHREVTKEDLEELRDVCHEVLCNHDIADCRLPTQGGFFFGDTTYDEWYFSGLEATIAIVDKVLETTNFDTQMIYYVSSW